MESLKAAKTVYLNLEFTLIRAVTVRNALNTTMIRQYNSYAKILCEDFNDVRC
jgi:hypothetical protein